MKPFKLVSRDFKEFGEFPLTESCNAATGNDSAKNGPLTDAVIFTLWNSIVNQIFNIENLKRSGSPISLARVKILAGC